MLVLATGDGVGLWSWAINTSMVARDWRTTSLTHGSWVSMRTIVGVVRGRNCSLSGSASDSDRLIVGIKTSGMTIPKRSRQQNSKRNNLSKVTHLATFIYMVSCIFEGSAKLRHDGLGVISL